VFVTSVFVHFIVSWPGDDLSLGSKLVVVYYICSHFVCWLWARTYIGRPCCKCTSTYPHSRDT